jgi:hypothetical protein
MGICSNGGRTINRIEEDPVLVPHPTRTSSEVIQKPKALQ